MNRKLKLAFEKARKPMTENAERKKKKKNNSKKLKKKTN